MDFIQPTGQDFKLSALPSVAMQFNGVFIEDELIGYRTLTVSGREMIGVELDTQSVRNGALTLDRRLPSRTLTIEYELKADDNYQFQKKFQQLRSILHTDGEVEVQFADEPDTYYYAQLSGVESVPNHTNHIRSSFTLHSDSPFKFGEPEESDGFVNIKTLYPTPTDEIRVTVDISTQQITVTNGMQEIRLDGNFASGETVTINTQEGTVKIGEQDVTYTVALNSDFENFVVEQGQTVTSPEGSIKLICREWWL